MDYLSNGFPSSQPHIAAVARLKENKDFVAKLFLVVKNQVEAVVRVYTALKLLIETKKVKTVHVARRELAHLHGQLLKQRTNAQEGKDGLFMRFFVSINPIRPRLSESLITPGGAERAPPWKIDLGVSEPNSFSAQSIVHIYIPQIRNDFFPASKLWIW